MAPPLEPARGDAEVEHLRRHEAEVDGVGAARGGAGGERLEQAPGRGSRVHAGAEPVAPSCCARAQPMRSAASSSSSCGYRPRTSYALKMPSGIVISPPCRAAARRTGSSCRAATCPGYTQMPPREAVARADRDRLRRARRRSAASRRRRWSPRTTTLPLDLRVRADRRRRPARPISSDRRPFSDDGVGAEHGQRSDAGAGCRLRTSSRRCSRAARRGRRHGPWQTAPRRGTARPARRRPPCRRCSRGCRSAPADSSRACRCRASSRGRRSRRASPPAPAGGRRRARWRRDVPRGTISSTSGSSTYTPALMSAVPSPLAGLLEEAGDAAVLAQLDEAVAPRILDRSQEDGRPCRPSRTWRSPERREVDVAEHVAVEHVEAAVVELGSQLAMAPAVPSGSASTA